MKLLAHLALASTVSVYVLIFVGGLVRVSGAGLGCPDWPLCYGRWIPPVHLGQLPADVNPEHFNFTLAWIEYLNRAIGAAVGVPILLTLALALWTARRQHSSRPLAWLMLAVVALVGFQAWLGGKVVSMKLAPWIVSVHLVVALIIVVLLILVTHRAYANLASRPRQTPTAVDGARRFFGVVCAIAMVQFLAGASFRGTLEGLVGEFPLLGDAAILSQSGWIKHIHAVLGSVVALLTCVGAVLFRKPLRNHSSIARVMTLLLAIIALTQVTLGALMGTIGLIPLLRVFHLWGATIAVGLLAALLLYLRRPAPATPTGPFLMGPLTGLAVGAACVLSLAFVAIQVTRQADVSRLPPKKDPVASFALINQQGEEITHAHLRGKVTVLDVVPATFDAECEEKTVRLADLAMTYAPSEAVQLLSVVPATVPAQLESLAATASPRWSILHGPKDVIERLGPGHNRSVTLVDQEGRARGRYDTTSEEELEVLRTHVRELARDQ